jgi:hypothetical protein
MQSWSFHIGISVPLPGFLEMSHNKTFPRIPEKTVSRQQDYGTVIEKKKEKKKLSLVS